MSREIRLGQLDADGKDLQAHYDPCRLLSDVVSKAPFYWVDHADSVGAEDDAEQGCERWLGEMQPITDEGGEERIEEKKTRGEEVSEMRGRRLEVLGEP